MVSDFLTCNPFKVEDVYPEVTLDYTKPQMTEDSLKEEAFKEVKANVDALIIKHLNKDSENEIKESFQEQIEE